MKKKELNTKKNTKQSKLLYKILFAICLVLFVGSMGLMISKQFGEQKAENKYDELAANGNLLEDSSEKEDETGTEASMNELEVLGITVPEKNIDWDALYEENEHIYAWIYIPGTKVDYPILQHPEMDDYYLNRNLDGSSGYPGCIYSETVTSKDFTNYNTLIYGHNMKNDTMFGSLHDYENAMFLDEYHYVYIYTPDKVLVYDIFAAYMYSDDHIYYSYDFGVAEGYQEYIDDIFAIRDMNANIRDDVEVTSEDYMLTMSTCMGGGRENNRYVVNAVLVNPSVLEKQSRQITKEKGDAVCMKNVQKAG